MLSCIKLIKLINFSNIIICSSNSAFTPVKNMRGTSDAIISSSNSFQTDDTIIYQPKHKFNSRKKCICLYKTIILS